mgnify:CR=1 FL=1
MNSANGRYFNLRLGGHPFVVIGTDGGLLPASYTTDTLLIAPGERYDIVFTEPRGTWILHCHIGHHLTNDGESPGGPLMVVNAG